MSTDPITMNALVERYLVHCRDEQRRSPHTVAAYSADLASLVAFAAECGKHDAADVTAEVLRGWLAHHITAGLARRTIARRASAARGLFTWAARTERIDHQPAAHLVVPKRAAKLPRVPTATGLRDVLSAAKTAAEAGDPVAVRDWAMLELLYATGARVAELVALDVDDVDTSSLMVLLRGKGDKERRVPFGRVAADATSAYLSRSRPSLAVERSGPALFLGARGGRIDPRRVREVVDSMLEDVAGGHPIGPHALRHAAATHMLDGGADLRTVQEQLGHASLASTQIYTQVSIDRLRVIYDRSHPRS